MNRTVAKSFELSPFFKANFYPIPPGRAEYGILIHTEGEPPAAPIGTRLIQIARAVATRSCTLNSVFGPQQERDAVDIIYGIVREPRRRRRFVVEPAVILIRFEHGGGLADILTYRQL